MVRVAPRGLNVAGVVTFDVRIAVTSTNRSLLRPDMTANVQIVTAEKCGAMLIPASAAVAEGGRSHVLVACGPGAAAPREVELGLSDGICQEVVRGLRAGETIVLPDPQQGWAGTADPGGRKAPAKPMQWLKPQNWK